MTGSTAVHHHLPDPAGINTGRGFDDLSPNERDQFINDLELDFRRYLAETRSSKGFVFYPSTRQIMKAISSLYQTLVSVDFSDSFTL
ncbi:hypothetical protein GGI15_001741 [Coemansia interrupta]|uniref:Uncharacterized protein n=1 Tax=Coemansia interrupta TaxID=1126814 RepID=A0A9W8HPF5_9FUNG|nr:hypothetical protein GGI15_001741 [Coemansia interrupta]